VENILEIEPVIIDEDEKKMPEPDEEEKPVIDDIPFEINRPHKDEDPSQMTLF